MFKSLPNYTVEISEKIKAKKCSVFFGAGLSYNSGLPIVPKLLGYLFEKLDLTQSQAKILTNSDLPFESIMETILDESHLSDILDIFDEGIPNTSHIFLAKLAKDGLVDLICTTNFDTLLEQAFIKQDLKKEDDFIVYSNQEDLTEIDWTSNKIKVIKIHGCVTSKDEMAITMKQVAGKILSTSRGNAIREIFSGNHQKNVLIMGYSCSDLFDISPLIEELTENLNEVILVEHCTNNSINQESIVIRKNKNPFKNFRIGTRLFINTDEFIKSVWSQLQLGGYIFEVYPETEWRKKIDIWCQEAQTESGESIKYHISARLFYDIGEYGESIGSNKKAMALAEKEGNLLGLSSAMGNLAMGYNRVLEHGKSEAMYKRSIPLCREAGNKKGEAVQLEGYGILLHNMGRNKEALDKHNAALALHEAMGDERSISTTLGNMGNVFNRLLEYDKTIKVISRALEISTRLGMKQSEGSQLAIIGMAYFNTGKIIEAKGHFTKSIQILRSIGDIQTAALIENLYNLATAFEG